MVLVHRNILIFPIKINISNKNKKNNFIIIQRRGIRKEPFAYKSVSTEFSWGGGIKKQEKESHFAESFAS